MNKKNCGFTIIEFLIASVLSSMLVLLIFNVFTSSLRSQVSIKQIVELETNSQSSLVFIARSIELAGYTEDVNASLSREVLFPENTYFGRGQAVAIADDGGRLYVRMYGGSLGVIRNCSGDQVGSGLLSTREITVFDGELVCRDFDKNLILEETTVVSTGVEHIEFIAELRDSVNSELMKSVLNSSKTDPDMLSAINVELIIKSNMPFTNTIKNKKFVMMSGLSVEWTDKHLYHKVNRVISTHNIGKPVELN